MKLSDILTSKDYKKEMNYISLSINCLNYTMDLI